MAVHGYVTHAARNSRYTSLLVLGYVLAFEVIGAFALIMPLLYWDYEHTILSNPAGYALRYALPIAVAAALTFWLIFRGHAKAVTDALGVQIVSRRDEPRFVQIAEEQCTALGVRLPRFGIIEAGEPNAVTVGEGQTRGLIAVTRGLLDRLDDDELAAVLAHEASHIRQGDTRLLAANHALMRTGVIMYMNNPLRMEDWRQLVLGVLIPPMLLLMLLGGAVTSACIELSRVARRGLRLGRDHVADGEAIRVTHFPEALVSAIEKTGGRGAFAGSHRVDGMLFDGRADHEGGSHPAIHDRLDAIRTLGGELMNPMRQRRDTRVPAQSKFGRRPHAFATTTAYPLDAFGVPLERPRPPSRHPLLTLVTDRALYMEWHNATVAWTESQLDQRRNVLGLAPKLLLPLIAAFAVMLYLNWPKDGDLSKLVKVMNPAGMVDVARLTSGTFCTGPSFPDGQCSTKDATAAKPASPFKQIGPAGTVASAHAGDGYWADGERWSPPSSVMPILMFGLMGLALFRPKLLRKIFGKMEPIELVRSKPVQPEYVKPPESDQPRPNWADISADEMIAKSRQLAQSEQFARSEQPVRSEQLQWRAPPQPGGSPSAPVFGRRRA
jgi:Zn-dependent protease with chaperone function